MSYYYNYTIGYEHDGKVYPLGPYDCFGRLRDVVCRSSNYASDLHEWLHRLPDEKVSDELRKQFTYKDWDENERLQDLSYIEVDALPSGTYIKSGYYLIEDVEKYEEEHDAYDLFYDRLSPVAYAARAHNEQVFGRPEPIEDEEGEKYYPHPVSDYMFYAYPDYSSKEYEADVLRVVAEMLRGYSTLPKGSKLVVLETEG